ncbi:FabD/lysophospholipase-like protein [Aspergillus novofumigatus IBT 16806]|uniref:FabD/lysophospholipase-like protein n=1 Tax=Aspergillus novofumigatus (strain IBT 16806) TaxID=1392255 RepID=A0A2I1CC05_ASPN1|nr:FabD/lysophospholipase-like protein [Aspergillus novofumigatus IBT 16806]PKX95157.1 FabD/lysophospholipase-like protein [Aspergillus novofumigatus IBT 16806]
MEQNTTLKPYSEPNPLNSTSLCLLSLDGGGVQGLSSLYILKSIVDGLNHVWEQMNLPPVKPCEVFNLIRGTGTRGQVDDLIAIMLGRLGMDVGKCIDTYSDLTATVFGEKLRSIPVNFKGKVTVRFDSAKLASAIKKVVEHSGASKQDLFNNSIDHRCRTFICTSNHHTKDSISHEPNIHVMICQAALATSATTTFFEPITIGDRSFADGGLGANNPVDKVEGEASNIWCFKTGDLKPLVKCFISIGTGNPGKKPLETTDANHSLTLTVAQLLETERINAEAENEDLRHQIHALLDRSKQRRLSSLKERCDALHAEVVASDESVQRAAVQYHQHLDQWNARNENFTQDMALLKNNIKIRMETDQEVRYLYICQWLD